MSPQAISSDEINLLIWKYLQESGFTHSTFAFQHESNVLNSEVKDVLVEPGSLVHFLQKGLQLQDLEAHVAPDGSILECSASRSLLTKHVCELKKSPAPPDKDNITTPISNGKRKRSKEEREDMDVDVVVNGQQDKPLSDSKPQVNGEEVNKVSVEPTKWKGHDGSVFIGCWNPAFPGILATGAGDATAKIWDVPKEAKPDSPVILKHLPMMQDKKDITALDWHPDGNVLATGSFDGQARLWDSQGALIHVLSKHEGPVFSLKWNKKGTLLLSCSLDGSAVIWDVEKGKPKQHWPLHQSGCLEVDWRDDACFASCSSDRTIKVVKVDEEKVIQTFSGHKDEVNTVQWDPSKQLIASCSDDKTVKIWSLDSNNSIHTFSHDESIYTCRWCPAGTGTANPAGTRRVASASWDRTVRIWNLEDGGGSCLYKLSRHTEPVYTLAYSPDGRFLASGSFDKTLIVWDANKGTSLMRHDADQGVFDLGWTSTGDRLVACLANGWIHVFNWDV